MNTAPVVAAVPLFQGHLHPDRPGCRRFPVTVATVCAARFRRCTALGCHLRSAGGGNWQAGHALDPRWAAYAGLGLLVLGMLTAAAFGTRLKRILLPLANEALLAARSRRGKPIPA